MGLEIQKIYNLSPMQEGMLFHALLNRDATAYFEQMAYELHGDLNIEVFNQTLNRLIERYEVLRTNFIHEGIKKPQQVVLKQRETGVSYTDISERSEDQQAAYIRDFKQKDREQGFDLSRDILMRVSILKTGTNTYELIWSFHHILMDGWCLGIISNDFFMLYHSIINNQPIRLEKVTPYSDYIQWLDRRERAEAKDYWRQYLEGYGQKAGIPKANRAHAIDIAGEPSGIRDIQFIIPEPDVQGLEKLAGENQVTVNTIFQTIWGILLQKYNNVEDVTFGAVVSGRPAEIQGIEKMVGLFINTAPVRIQTTAGQSFRDLVKQNQAKALAGEKHAYVSLAEIQADTELKQDLLDHILGFENYPVEKTMDGLAEKIGFRMSKFEVFEETNYDFNVVVIPGKEWEIVLKFNPKRYDTEFIGRIGGHLQAIVRGLIAHPDIAVGDIDILMEEERTRLLYEFNNTEAKYPKDKTIHQLFEEQAARTPDNIAVIYEEKSLTYRELNAQANQLAGMLRKKGVKPGVIVGVMVERSLEMIIGILGIIKAGGAYLPLDPSYPGERLLDMLEDSSARFLLVKEKQFKDFKILSLTNISRAREKTAPVITTEPRPQICNLDNLPIPDRSLIDYSKYQPYIGLAMVKNSIAIQATRGCPYQCAYCHKIWPKAHEVRSAEHIFQEVEMYYRIGIRRFVFVDDIFNLDQKNSMRFFNLVIEHGLQIQIFFPNGVRGDILTREYIDLMIKAGTVSLAIALETASPRLQKLIHKNLRLDKVRENIDYIAMNYPQVILELFAMHGFPTETEDEARETLDFIKNTKWLHFPYFHILKIYPGTDMAQLALVNGISEEALEHSMDLAYHELPDTLPFAKKFTLECQTEFLHDYFLSKERLLKVLPYQMKVLTQDEIVQKYNSYLPVKINTWQDLLEFVGITDDQLEQPGFLDDNFGAVSDFNAKIATYFPAKIASENAPKILLMDLSQLFSGENDEMLYDVVEPPLGLMYLLTYLNQKFGPRIHGKIVKSRIDFNNYHELKQLLEEYRPDLIGIRTLTFYRDFFHKTVSLIRQWGFEMPIIAGGPYATSDYQRILQDPHVDLVVLGEGEITFSEIIEKFLANHSLPNEPELATIPGIAYITEDDKKSLIFNKREIICIDQFAWDESLVDCENPAPVSQPDDLAYIIYTSGSTGKSKGVMIEHRNVVRLLFNERMPFDFDEKDVWTMFHSFSFDFSVWEMYGALLYGGKLIVIPRLTAQDPKEYLKLLKKEQVTVLNQTPSMFYNIALEETGDLHHDLKLRYIIFGGEALQPLRLQAWHEKYPDTKLINMYGITETTVHVTYKELTEEDLASSISNIGNPIPTLTTYICDRNMRLTPIGVAGELCVGGAGVGRGYLNRPELTAERFVKNPHRPEERIYRSGDLARWLENGDLEYLGRIDQQVKIRGHRIELGEIETGLIKHERINDAVLTVKTDADNNKYLCAYLVLQEDLTIQEIREFLGKSLPEYMIPSYFIRIDKLPVNSNGKIDRRQLPESGGNIRIGADYAAPRNMVETKLVKIWQEVLGVAKIGVHDNFFELGGDSIRSIQIAARLYKEGLKLEVKDLFQYPTIKELNKHVTPVIQDIDQGVVSGEVVLTPIQAWFFDAIKEQRHCFNQSVMLYKEHGFDENIIRDVFTAIVAHHDALRMVYQIENKEIKQYNRDSGGELFQLKVFDFTGKTDTSGELAPIVQQLYQSIALNQGPLVNLGLFKMPEGDHLLIIIHHLVVDGVSWRIILEDFKSGYLQALNHKKIQLPLKTNSFKEWASSLTEYANSGKMQAEINYWQEIEAQAIPPLVKDYDTHTRSIMENASLDMMFSETETAKLLKECNLSYNTEINDLLLTALGITIKNWTKNDKVLITMEGHGREEILAHLNITRTIGWFTTSYPVILHITDVDSMGYCLKTIKESLRRIPHKGIGYGILRYLKRDSLGFKLQPEISFNYLGQFDQEINTELFKASELQTRLKLPEMKRQYALEINGMVVHGRLMLTFGYNRNEYQDITIQRLINDYRDNLQSIIDHCSAKDEIEPTPADFDNKVLDISELDETLGFYRKLGLEVQKIYNLSPMQEGMLFHTLLGEGTTAYFEQIAFDLQGGLDIDAFRQTFDRLMDRYEILRTNFLHEMVKRPQQIVLKKRKTKLEFVDIRHLPDGEKTGYVEEFSETDRQRGFDLSREVLIRIAILRIQDDSYKVIWSFHHILMDGWCMGIIIKDFFIIYQALIHHHIIDLPEVTPYSTHVKWLDGQERETARKYWQQYLSGYEEKTMVPQKSGGQRNEFRSGEFQFAISEPDTRELEQLATLSQVTLNTVFQSIWGILLQRYNSNEDVVFGAVVSGRPATVAGIEKMVGLFINTIPVRIQSRPGQSFAELIKQVQANALTSESYSYMSLAEIQGATALKQDLIDHIVVFENYPVETEIMGLPETVGFNLTKFEAFEQTNYDFNIIVTPGKELISNLKFNRMMYDEEFIQRIGGHFQAIVREIIANPHKKISEFEIISDSEKRHIIYELNNTAAEYPKNKTIQQLFEEQVERTPENIAVVFGDKQLTYGELNKKANQLAGVLRAKGVKPDKIVGVMVERSLEMIIGIIAVLKSGGAYLPIDPEYPIERVKYMLADSQTELLLTQKAFAGKQLTKEQLYLEDEALYQGETSNLEPVNQVTDLSYIIFTSGTTGHPKGAMIEHYNVARLLFNSRNPFDFTGRDVWTMFHSYCFDFSVWEMYGALLYGGKLIIIPRTIAQEPQEYLRILRRQGVTILNQTPTMFYNIAAEEMKDLHRDLRLRYIIFGGEALQPVMLKAWRDKYPDTRLINMYGITETTVHVTYKEITQQDIALNISNIGKPIPTLTAYVMNKQLKILPLGVAGELMVGGAGVGRGYLNCPELTERKFVTNPYQPNERLYASGDLVRLLANGDLEYLGRIDHQVKIRGFRIELGEIEAQLLKHETIKKALVIARKSTDTTGEAGTTSEASAASEGAHARGARYLCAYLVGERELTVPELREYLSLSLPEYMIPSYFIYINQIPLTPNGKVDRKALPEPEGNINTGIAYEEPRNDIERQLVTIWQEVLGLGRVGINDNFFYLGGDSIKSIQISARLYKYGLKIEIRDLFQHPTIGELSEHVTTIMETIDQGVITGEAVLTPVQRWFFDEYHTNRHHFNQSILLSKETGFDEKVLREVWRAIIEHHDALRMVYRSENGAIKQYNRDIDAKLYDLEIIDLSNQPDVREAIESHTRRIQQSIDLGQGPLVKTGLFKTATADYLLIIIHHLVVDGVSWRIILEDLTLGYEQTLKSEPIQLAAKTHSYQEWARRLEAHGNSSKIEPEINYWLAQEEQNIKRLPKDHLAKERQVKDSASQAMMLPEADTEKMLKESNRAYNTEINDLLLTALGMTIKDWNQTDKILINLEGHGREEIIDGINILRTVGWFTTIYPVILDMSDRDLGYQIKTVKESLRRIPNKGISYGILKYLRTGADTPLRRKPEISFNYLGQFDQDINTGLFKAAEFIPGFNISPEMEQQYALDINGVIMNGRLSLTFSYNRYEYDRETIEGLIESYRKNLLAVISHCASKKEQEATPSDLEDTTLSIDEADQILDFYSDLS